MTTTVLVLSDEGRTALGTLDNVRPVGYDPAGPMPEEAADAEVLVVPFRHTQRTLAAMREMPKLRLVQTLSAGTEVWQGHLPDGVRLSNCRAHTAAPPRSGLPPRCSPSTGIFRSSSGIRWPTSGTRSRRKRWKASAFSSSAQATSAPICAPGWSRSVPR